MIKLYIFESVEDAKKFECGETHVVLDAVSIKPDVAAIERIVRDEPPEVPARRKYKKHKKTAASSGTCFCGREAGHRGIHRGGKIAKKRGRPRKDTEVPAGTGDEEKSTLSCHICELDHMTRDCPDFISTIAGMRGSGMDSLQIAAKLKIRLKDIPVE